MPKSNIVIISPFPESQERVEETKCPVEAPGGWGCRHTMAVLTFFGSIVSYMLRSNLSMAIVAMVHHEYNPNRNLINNTHKEYICPDIISINNNTTFVQDNTNITLSTNTTVYEVTVKLPNQLDGEFHWDTQQQGIILGSFFWGYVVTHVPAGLWAEKFGAKWVFGIGLLTASVFAFLIPIAARLGYGIAPLVIVRIIQGLGEGVTPPSTHVLVTHWAPPCERCKLGAFIYSGNQAGTMLGMIISGFIIHSKFLGGWPGVFYAQGTMGIIWFVFWCFFLFSKPSEHPTITQEELHYIESTLQGQTSKKSISTPWRRIFLSMPMWAILVAQTGNSWGLYTLTSELPSYLHRVLQFDIKSNSYFSAMPFFCMIISAIIASQLGDTMRAKKIWKTTTIRKFFNSLGHVGAAVCLVAVAYFGCDQKLAIIMVTAAMAFCGCIGAGYQMNHVDISPNHSGVLMALCNGVANLTGIAAPYVAGIILKDGDSLSDWQLVFLIAAGVYFLDNFFYLIFASAEVQSWNQLEEIKTQKVTDLDEQCREVSERL